MVQKTINKRSALFWHGPELNPFEFAYLTLCLLNAVVIINLDSLKRYEIMQATIGARKNNCCFILFTMIYRDNTHLPHLEILVGG